MSRPTGRTAASSKPERTPVGLLAMLTKTFARRTSRAKAGRLVKLPSNSSTTFFCRNSMKKRPAILTFKSRNGNMLTQLELERDKAEYRLMRARRCLVLAKATRRPTKQEKEEIESAEECKDNIQFNITMWRMDFEAAQRQWNSLQEYASSKKRKK
jgi:hypothetical protein